jgi:hypothetical protein
MVVEQHVTSETHDLQAKPSAPGRTRTCDLRIRSPLLYPAELQGPAGRSLDRGGPGFRDNGARS